MLEASRFAAERYRSAPAPTGAQPAPAGAKPPAAEPPPAAAPVRSGT